MSVNTNSASFDGVNDYFSITDAAQTGLDLTTALTIEAWVKPSSLGSDGNVFGIACKGNSTLPYAFNLTHSSSNTVVQMYVESSGGSDSVNYTLYSDTTTMVGKWVHLAWTWDGATKAFLLYADGAQVNSASGTTVATIHNTADPFLVGKLAGAGAVFFSGHIDDVRVWNVVRTAKQIADNRSVELAGTESGLVGYWKFNDAATDSTSNGNNLTANGGATYSSPKDPAFWGRSAASGGGARSFGSFGY